MEVVQSGPLVCASRTSSSHPPPHPRLVHRLDGDPTSALHVQTEEGGGGLDPGWWKISASGSWDNGERRMRYGKLIDDRPGEIPGAVQRRKLEMLETHAPGASMRVVHSQSTASWVQDPNSINSSGLSSNISNSRRSVHASSSSSTRVTSFRQWSSNFSQNSANNVGIKHETRPAITEFGNLELDLNPLDVSFLRTRGNVGRSGSIGARRPPSRGRRASSEAPLGSPESEDGSKTPSPIPRLESSGIKIHDISTDGGEAFIEGFRKGVDSRSEWNPTASPVEADSGDRRDSGKPSYSTPRLQTVLHRKRSVSSEDLRAAEDGEEEDVSSEDPEGKWRRGAGVRRSLPSSEWRSVVGAADEMRQRLRPRDPFKSSSVPTLGCSNTSSSSSRRGSFVTAESLREMKGRLKHRGGASDAVLRPKAIEAKSSEPDALTSKDEGEETLTPRASPFFLRASATRENSLGGRQQHQQQDAQDDRRKSWSVGCRNLVKRGVEEESEGMSNRRRSYAFEYSVDEGGSSEEKENLSVVRQMQEGRGDAQRGKLRVDQQPYFHNRVNEVLKKWSALSKGEEAEDRVEAPKSSDSSPIVIRRNFEEEECSVRNSTTWLDRKESHANSASKDVSDFSPATMSSGGRTTLRVIQSKSPNYKDDTLSDVCGIEKGIPESSFSVTSESMEDYMSSHGLAPIDWTENESRASKEIMKNETKANTSAGISVIFSNADAEHNVKHHCSVTHLESRDGDASKSELQGFKLRSSKKVEFSKTEVHFAAESGRFHIVETAGKPPPSNNFRRRRRSPTGTLNVDSGGRLGSGVTSPSTVTNGMRFGDSPYEMRLLAGTDNLDLSSRRNDEDYSDEQTVMDDHTANGDSSLEYTAVTNTKAKVYNDLVIDEEIETKEVQKNTLDCEATNSSSTFLHLGLDDLSSEKPRSILRSVAAENSPQWKLTQKDIDDVDNEDFKPKFGGVRLRPVVSPVSHSTINVISQETSDILGTSAMDTSINDSLSPGQMELQKLLRSLRHVSMTYNENPNTSSIQIANGGGMEVRISSGSQAAVTNTVIIGNDPPNTHTPLSVAQRVREVEERRQKELSNRLSANPRPTTRAAGQFSTRVTLGSGSSSIVSLESQVPRKTSVSHIESAKPVSPKPAAKLSTNNKITRIHSTQGVASGIIGDSLQHSEVATTSEIKISARLTEHHPENEHVQDVPRVTRIALGFQDKAKDGARHTDPKTDLTATKGGAVHSTVVGCKLDTSLREKPGRIPSHADEMNVETREKNTQEAIHSRQAKYKISSSSKDIVSGWRCIEVKDKKDEELGRSDPVIKGVRSQKRVKQITSNIAEKSPTKATFSPLNSPTAENKGFPSDVTNFETLKEESRMDDVTEQFSIKMKVIKNQADEEKTMATQDSSSPGQTKTTSQYDYLQHRRTNINTLTSATKLHESEGSCAQKSRKEIISRSDSRKDTMQALKSPTMNHRNRLNAGSPLTVNPETSSPSSGRAVRKRLRKRSSGGSSSKVPSTSERKREGHDEESTILEELTKAADEILHAVNGYSDEASSDEDIEAAKNETRSKRKPPSKKDSVSRKISSSGRESKGSGSQRGSIPKSREGKARVSNGMMTPSAEAVQVPIPEVPTAGPESQRTSRGTRVASPVAAVSSAITNSSSRGGNVSAISEKSQKSKQQQLVGSSKKGMTRIEPTNRVPEVKLIEKRPPLPPTGQRRTAGTKERSEAPVRGTHGKTKTTTSLVYNKDGDVEGIKEVKRPLNIARALEAVMPDSRTKTRKIDQKVDAASIIKISEAQKKEGSSSNPASAQSSPGTSNSIERKKVASSRDGDKTTRRRVHQNIISPT